MPKSKTARLIYVDPINNNNKFYNLDLFDDGRLEINWGRVGANGQFQTTHGGERTFNSKIKSKEKKGYVVQKTVQTDTIVDVPTGDLTNLAKNQIKTDSTLAETLIERLVKANIHQITSNTQIKYDSKSGVFQTPLGVVTLEGIGEAKELLEKMSNLKDKTCDTFYKHAGNYLKIIPQKVGSKVKTFIDNNFAEADKMTSQFDLLESLEVSFNTITNLTAEPTDTTEDVVEEQVFDLSIEILEDKVEHKRLSDNFYNSKKGMHNYGNVKIKNIYKVKLGDMDRDFDNKNWGNIQEFYHGTGIANCLSIMKAGLKVAPPSTAAIAGKLFSNGVYGATSSSKSLGYSLGRWGQGRSNDGAWLFVCDFAMGNTEMVTSCWGTYPNKGYDSVTALAKNTSLYNDEFIVYTNQQVNIKYLIECST
jgi:poly [ADP-ribose] polymerase 2/3/4